MFGFGNYFTDQRYTNGIFFKPRFFPARRTCSLRPRTSEQRKQPLPASCRDHRHGRRYGLRGHQTWDLLEALLRDFERTRMVPGYIQELRSRALVLLDTLRHTSESGGKSCEMHGCPLSKVRFLLNHSFSIFV